MSSYPNMRQPFPWSPPPSLSLHERESHLFFGFAVPEQPPRWFDMFIAPTIPTPSYQIFALKLLWTRLLYTWVAPIHFSSLSPTTPPLTSFPSKSSLSSLYVAATVMPASSLPQWSVPISNSPANPTWYCRPKIPVFTLNKTNALSIKFLSIDKINLDQSIFLFYELDFWINHTYILMSFLRLKPGQVSKLVFSYGEDRLEKWKIIINRRVGHHHYKQVAHSL